MSALRISPERLDQLVRFNKIAENVWSLDAILRVLSYSGLLGAQMLTSMNGGKESPLAAFLGEFFNKLTDARFINRVGGLPATLESLFMYASETKPDKSLLGVLGRIMTWSMVVYYPLEHVWLLSTFKPKVINVDSDKWSMWSCRAWAVYVICDLVGTLKRAQTASVEIKAAEKGEATAGDDKKELVKRIAALKEQRKQLYIWATCVISDLVMALHWSVPDGPVSTNQICAVGIWGGVASLYLKWNKSCLAE